MSRRQLASRDTSLPYLVLQALLVGAAYYLAARLSLRMALIEENVTPLWPPTGIAVVAFLVFGRRIWPGIALAAFMVNAPITASPLAAAATAAGNTVAPMVAAELLTRVGFRKEIDRTRDAMAIVLAAPSSMLISATVGAGTLVLSDTISARDFPSAWTVWWTGDAMGVLVVAPFLLSLLHLRRSEGTSWARRAEAGGLFLLITLVSLAVTRTQFGLMFLVLPFLGWAAWRFQQRGSAPAALLVSGIASWAAAHGWAAFREGPLFERMLTLQAFNATVAFTSFFFAAMVTERMRDRDALEGSALLLEERVRQRTKELSTEISERRAAEKRLRQRERQLADAQQVARVGSWEWLVKKDRVTWSDEMYRIHGYRPQEFPVTFEKAVELVLPEDLERIRQTLAANLTKGRDRILPTNEYRIRRTDGAERVFLGKAALHVDAAGEPLRMVGTVQDITEERRAERVHRIAETLQRSLLPDRLPTVPGVSMAARYVPTSTDAEIGGDWFDVVQLPNGHLGVAIGDVAGHGLRAASTMGQLRMALRAYAIEEDSPAAVVGRLEFLVRTFLLSEMATLVYLVFDPDSGVITFANAGHPPPLVIEANGETHYLGEGLSPPIGAAPGPDSFIEASSHLSAGSTLLLFTDGLIERRRDPLHDGLARLREVVSGDPSPDLDTLCEHILASLLGKEISDDVAILALRPIPLAGASSHIQLPAEPRALAPLRHTLRRWLREIDAGPQESYEILVACGEACANAIQHPYGAKDGSLQIDLGVRAGEIEVVVRDGGTWRRSSPANGGSGLRLMRDLMDSVDVESGPKGTVVRLRRRLGGEAFAGRPRTY
jgi:PAS domain S-box-containing protein